MGVVEVFLNDSIHRRYSYALEGGKKTEVEINVIIIFLAPELRTN